VHHQVQLVSVNCLGLGIVSDTTVFSFLIEEFWQIRRDIGLTQPQNRPHC
jgi:hypothetical protein